MSRKARKPKPVKKQTKKPKFTKKLIKKPVNKRATSSAAKKPDPLALVREKQPTINKDAEPQYQVIKVQKWFLDVIGIPGLVDGELEAILEREGVKNSYELWREAKALVQVLSEIGGIQSVTIVGESVRTTRSRSEMWIGGKCVSIDGGVTKLTRKSKEDD